MDHLDRRVIRVNRESPVLRVPSDLVDVQERRDLVDVQDVMANLVSLEYPARRVTSVLPDSQVFPDTGVTRVTWDRREIRVPPESVASPVNRDVPVKPDRRANRGLPDTLVQPDRPDILECEVLPAQLDLLELRATLVIQVSPVQLDSRDRLAPTELSALRAKEVFQAPRADVETQASLEHLEPLVRPETLDLKATSVQKVMMALKEALVTVAQWDPRASRVIVDLAA